MFASVLQTINVSKKQSFTAFSAYKNHETSTMMTCGHGAKHCKQTNKQNLAFCINLVYVALSLLPGNLCLVQKCSCITPTLELMLCSVFYYTTTKSQKMTAGKLEVALAPGELAKKKVEMGVKECIHRSTQARRAAGVKLHLF